MREGAEFRELMLQIVRTRMAFRRSMQRTLRKNNAGITFEMLQEHQFITTVGKIFFPMNIPFLFQIIHQIGETCLIFCNAFRQYLLTNSLLMP